MTRFESVEADILLVAEIRRQEREKQEQCLHRDHEHGICVDCGADRSDHLRSQAEFRRECREDR